MEEAKMKIHGISRGDFLANKKKKKSDGLQRVAKKWGARARRDRGSGSNVRRCLLSRRRAPLLNKKLDGYTPPIRNTL